MPQSTEALQGDDDLARQRRKREARLLDQRLVDTPDLTLADVVADVLAASDAEPGSLDVRGYLAAQGHHRGTIEAVVDFLDRQHMPGMRLTWSPL